MTFQLKSTILTKLRNFIFETVSESLRQSERRSPVTQSNLKVLYQLMKDSNSADIFDYGLSIFSQTDEDGKILYALAKGVQKNKNFIEIGSANCVDGSNCANLIVNMGFTGLFIDVQSELTEYGKKYYKENKSTEFNTPKIINDFVSVANINNLISGAGFTGEVDVLSIDIDGNDYWIWKAIKSVKPRLVIVETHIEWGDKNLTVKYNPNFTHEDHNNQNFGMSAPAAISLARKLGYYLAGSNDLGFNLFFIRNDLKNKYLREISLKTLLNRRFNLVGPYNKNNIPNGKQFVEG